MFVIMYMFGLSNDLSQNLAIFFIVNLHCLVVTSSAIQVKVTLMFAGYFDTFSYPFVAFKYLFLCVSSKACSKNS
jgi:hypothetical protein